MRNTVNGHMGNGLTYKARAPIINRHEVASKLRLRLSDLRRRMKINEKMGRGDAALKCYRKIVKIERALTSMGEAI